MQTPHRAMWLILLLFTAFLCLISAEIACRIIGVKSSFIFQKDEADFIQYDASLGYRYLPNLELYIQNENYSITVKTNTHGFRDQAWKAFSGKKILVVGDSYSAGYGLNREQRWSDRLEEMLNSGHELTDSVKIYNAAVSGFSLEQMQKTASVVEPLVKPSAVIVGLYIEGLGRIHDPFVYLNGFSVKSSKVPFAKTDKDRLFLLHSQNSTLKNIEAFLLDYSKFFQFSLYNLFLLKQQLQTPNPSQIDSLGIQDAKRIGSVKNRMKK